MGGEAAVVADSGVCASVRACAHALCHENCGGLVAAVVAFDSIVALQQSNVTLWSRNRRLK